MSSLNDTPPTATESASHEQAPVDTSSFAFLQAVSTRTKFSLLRGIQRHDGGDDDDDESVPSQYQDESSNDLGVWQGATLLMADCLGTGLLALPYHISVILERPLGVFFLVLQLPINYYAGSILSQAALYVEERQGVENQIVQQVRKASASRSNLEMPPSNSSKEEDRFVDEDHHEHKSIAQNPRPTADRNYKTIPQRDEEQLGPEQEAAPASNNIDVQLSQAALASTLSNQQEHHDTATFDFIGMTAALFGSHSKTAIRAVMILFYTNIFLVLGDYLLVASHAVVAVVNSEDLCLPEAGGIAMILLFGVAQLRTMAKLGRVASFVSLAALGIVLVQCLVAVHTTSTSSSGTQVPQEATIFRKLSALGSIGFAVGSQKLFLNIRHELADRTTAPTTLGIALTGFGSLYVALVFAAGRDPPSFLFDAIPEGSTSRQFAGLFLWIHVVVSYAINSQAICASIDRLFLLPTFPHWTSSTQRWVTISATLSLLAFGVANAIPFFKDLVALIGALTSVPLTLMLPAIFYRRMQHHASVWLPWPLCSWVVTLLVFSVVFTIAATLGAIDSIGSDWSVHTGGFFACHPDVAS